MRRIAHAVLFAGGAVAFILAIGYFFQMPWAIRTWLWPDSRLSYIFIASIQAAVGIAIFVIALSREWGLLAAGTLNLVVMTGGISAFLFRLASEPERAHLLVPAIACGLFALVNLGLFLWAHRRVVYDRRPRPRLVTISYVGFVLALLAAGGALLQNIPGVMPWPLQPETAVVIGWIFIGDASYFLYALLRHSWSYARTQLWSFLVYDLVLIGPFLGLLDSVRPELTTSLRVYLLVLLYSGGLAFYYLLLNKSTREWSPRTVRKSLA